MNLREGTKTRTKTTSAGGQMDPRIRSENPNFLGSNTKCSPKISKKGYFTKLTRLCMEEEKAVMYL